MATTYGYALSSEEHRPLDLVRYAQRAEELGFAFVSLSDQRLDRSPGAGAVRELEPRLPGRA